MNGKLVKMGLVETLIEVVELFKLVVHLLIDTKNFLDLLVRLLLSIRVALEEGEDLLFLRLELTAELCSLKDALSKLLVAAQSLHAAKTIGDEGTEMLLLLGAELSHLSLKVMVVLLNLVLFKQ